MNHIVYKFTLDVHSVASQAMLSVRKGDAVRRLSVTFCEDGAPYSIADGCYAVFNAVRSDGAVLFCDCAIKGDVITCDLKKAIASAEGRLDCDITLYSSDGEPVTSPRFSITVYAGVTSGDEVEDTDEYRTLGELVVGAERAADAAEESAQASAASANAAEGIAASTAEDIANTAMSEMRQEVSEAVSAMQSENAAAVNAANAQAQLSATSADASASSATEAAASAEEARRAAESAASGGVTSFNGRTGAVEPQVGDYTAEMVGADASGTAADAVRAHNNDGKAHGGPFAPSEHNHDGVYAPSEHTHEGADITDLAEHMQSLGYTLETKGSYIGDDGGVVTIQTENGGENADNCVIYDLDDCVQLSQRVITLPIDASTIEIYVNGTLKTTFSKGYAKYAYANHTNVYYQYNNNYRIKVPLIEFTGTELRITDAVYFHMEYRYWDEENGTTYNDWNETPKYLYAAESGSTTTNASNEYNNAGTTYTYIAY